MVDHAPLPRAFRPRLLPTLAAAALLPLLLWLGGWQLERAGEKGALTAAFAAARGATPAPYATGLPRFSRVVARGRWDATRQFLLDATVHEGRVGFRVLTPLVLDDGRVLLVDRGWVAGDPARRTLPAVAFDADGPVEAVGLIDELPRAGIASAPAAATAGWPRVVLYPTRDALAAALGAPLEPGLLRLDPAAPDGYARGFAPDFGVSRERHLGYAFTWFALAATLVAIWIVTNLRPREGGP
jgi:surfeit locus 1 family protein